MSKKVAIINHLGREKLVDFASLVRPHDSVARRGDIIGVTFVDGQDLSGVGGYEHLTFMSCTIRDIVLPDVKFAHFDKCSIDELSLTGNSYIYLYLTHAQGIKVASPGTFGIRSVQSSISGLVVQADSIRITASRSELNHWDLSNVPILATTKITESTNIHGLIVPSDGMKVDGDVYIHSCPQQTWDEFDSRFILQGAADINLHIDSYHTSVVSTVRREKDSNNPPIRISAAVAGGDSDDSLLCDPSDLVGILPIHRYSKTDEDEYTDVVAFTGKLVSIGCQHLSVKKARLATKLFSEHHPDRSNLVADDALAYFVHIVEDETSRRELVAHWGPLLLQIIDAMKKQRKRTIKHMGEFTSGSTIVMGV